MGRAENKMLSKRVSCRIQSILFTDQSFHTRALKVKGDECK